MGENVKQVWKILVPTMGNDGVPFKTKQHKRWDEKVCNLAGGMTILRPVFGKWIHNGMSYQERNIPVEIVCTREELSHILSFTKTFYNQEAILAVKVSDEAIIYDGMKIVLDK